ncbi:YhcB family protein [Ferrimonas senticii]|uniref:YhcB family protein n=1 Tax=Ferrimonas senticii TaxID=394566 RepID=UPI0004232A17|nr:DUF1043 family protein [Ferrimonas senticii]
MNEMVVVAAAAVALVIGFFIGRRGSGGKASVDKLQQELAQARFELEQQRQGLNDHFTQSKQHLAALAAQLEKTQAFWQESARELSDEPAAAEPEEQIVIAEADNVTSLPPNDYVQGSHGIINPEPKAANQ